MGITGVRARSTWVPPADVLGSPDVLRATTLLFAFLIAHDAPVRAVRQPLRCAESELFAARPPARVERWTQTLAPVEVTHVATHAAMAIQLYTGEGEVDPSALRAFDEVAANDDESGTHPLAARLSQLVVKAAYHFARRPKDSPAPAKVIVISGFRSNAGRHGTGEAVDFKLAGVRASELAAYLRQLPRVGVGVYTHPRTQFVHLDVRDASYHWLDASPPGVHWREAMLRDPRAKQRDASWSAEMDLP